LTELRLGQINTVDIDTSEFASANAVNTVQANVTSLAAEVATISGNVTANPDSAANDFTTYSTLSTLINTVSENASSHSSTFWEGYADTTALAGGYISNGFTVVSGVGAYFGEGGSWTQLATLASVNTVNDNVTALDNNAWVNSNDYSTYNTLSSLIDTVQDNISSSSSTTDLYIDNTLISNSALFIESGNGLSVTANATSKVVTFTVGMSNVTSQEFTANGSSNTFTLAKSVSNSHMILVSYNGILQKPTTYDISDTTLTLSNTLPIKANSDVEVRYFDFFDLPGVTTGSSGGGSSYSFQGENFGYTSGGFSSFRLDTIDKFPFSSDSNATDVAELPGYVNSGAGQSSSTHGYNSGGNTPTGETNQIVKFPFSSSTSGTDIADLTQARYAGGGQSSATHGYTSGSDSIPGEGENIIDKFPFSSDSNATDVGDLTQGRGRFAGSQSSSTHGYVSGGILSSTSDVIEKFPFSSDTNATDVAELLAPRSNGSQGQSSDTHGYVSGGPPSNNDIEKFTFSSDAPSTSVGSLSIGGMYGAGQSSTSHGYTSGGYLPGITNTIDKFPFSSDTNATDVGDLTQARQFASGQQY